MIGWIILGVIVLLLAVILLTPVGARVSYEQGELTAQARYGPLKLQLYPLKKAKESGKKKKKKAKKKKPEKPKKKRAKINREQIFYSLETLPPVLAKALRRVRQRIVVTPLTVYLRVAGTDPADTAQLYGRLTAALANGLPVLQKVLRVREQDIQVYLDFTEDTIGCMADVGVSIRPWDVLVIGVCAGASLLKWLLGFRKLASPPPAEEPEKDENSETSKAA